MDRVLVFALLIVYPITNSLKQQGNLCDRVDSCIKDDEVSKVAHIDDEIYDFRNCYCDSQCAIYNDCCENYLVENNSNNLFLKRNFTCNQIITV